MPERRLLWPLLAYGALGVIALARQGELRRPRRERSAPERARAHPDRRPNGERAREAKSVQSDCAQAHWGRSAHAECAHEHGRRGRADSPWAIPWSGWKDILGRTYAKIDDNRLMAVAASVVFYSLLALSGPEKPLGERRAGKPDTIGARNG